MKLNYYHILGLTISASQEEIKTAYRQLAKKCNPDKNPDSPLANEQFKKINEAYSILSNKQKKAFYDLSLTTEQIAHITSPPYYRTGTGRYYRSPRYYKKTGFVKKQYTRQAKVLSFFTVLAIVSTIIGVTYILVNYTSTYHYRKSVQYYENHQYNAALNSLQHSIQIFGNKNPEACLLAGKIITNYYHNYKDALLYIDQGLASSTDPHLEAALLYLKGQCLKNLKH